ncbi:MAG: glutamine--fructose-6-phosphate transaminase (isomerizing) [Vampirovibrionales bacterium]
MMCGIVGYIGKRPLLPLIAHGLEQLEYRGYDSAGIALMNPASAEVATYKATGKLANLRTLLPLDTPPIPAGELQLGIGHIRWATHGAPTEQNAHPHQSQAGQVVLVHNGIIENYAELKHQLTAKGFEFVSETDTETIAHCLEDQLSDTPAFFDALQATKRRLRGAYALVLMTVNEPDTLYATRQQAPLVVGVGDGEYWLASDVVALVKHTDQVLYLNDGETVRLTAQGLELFDANGHALPPHVETIQTGPLVIDKRGYKHFMLKEIYEQPDVVRNALMDRLHSANLPILLNNDTPLSNNTQQVEALLKDTERLVIVGCGTSYHAGMVAKQFIEAVVRLPVSVESAGEYRYANPIVNERTLVVAISQSGETADTLEAVKQVKALGAKVLVLTNRPDSSMAREAHAVMNVRAGVEVSVAATKSFIAQIVALYLVGIAMAEQDNRTDAALLHTLKQELFQLPTHMEATLSQHEAVQKLARSVAHYRSMLFIGRGINHPTAMEAALKLKEVSYIHAEAYSGSELKHGPIALLDEHMPVVAVLAEGVIFEKMLSNCQEAQARDAKVIGFTNHVIPAGMEHTFEHLLHYPPTHELLSPLVASIPLQLLAYYVALFLGKDVDQPRNLAKSVTVE